MSKIGTTTAKTTTTGTTMSTRTIGVGLMFPHKIENLAIMQLGVVCQGFKYDAENDEEV